MKEGSGGQLAMYCMIGIAVLAVIIVIAAVVLALGTRKRYREGRAVKHLKVGNGILGSLGVLLLAAVVALGVATNMFANQLNNVFYVGAVGSEEVDTTEDDWKDLARQIGQEGMTLMRNNNEALPLSSGAKVNLLGYYAYNPYFSGGGSGRVSATEDSADVLSSLEDAGIEINPALQSAGVYEVLPPEPVQIGFHVSPLTVNEVTIDKFTGDASFESMKEYSDTAVIVLGRTGSEGADLTSYEQIDDANYLQLNDNEKALMQRASETFDKIIVVINSANALEMGFLDEYSVDACVWAGLPGPYGFDALGKILTGEINPSGKLPDTWVTDNDSAPANENYGTQVASNAEASHYVDYVEGIYVGYKWYETAYAEGAVVTNTTTGETFDYGSDYDSIVSFPFGSGLSYTTFAQTITGFNASTLDPKGTVSVDVEVTNTGDVAGKEVVQLYMTAPYTDYDRENGVEKAAVQLIGYGKTAELAPGTSETVTVEVPVEDLAAYDTSHDNGDGTQGAYMLDAGEYVFSVRANAHESLDEVTAELAESHFYSGDDQRASDGQSASNQFDEASRGVYLSRADGFANYTEAMESVSDEVNSTANEDDKDAYDASYDENIPSMTKGVDYAADGDLTLDDVRGLDYDDPQWDELIKQLTVDELKSLVEDSTYASPSLLSIGKDFRTVDSDGPMGISSMWTTSMNGIAYPCIPLLAATFNVDIATEFGEQMADQTQYYGTSGWYAPAMNNHRSAFSGRNFEYYSEDAVLAGTTASAQVKAAREGGLIVYIKHFALNDMESVRHENLHTYSNEQAIREIYLKPFEDCVKKGGATAVMASMNFIGDTYAGANESLLTEVLRNEWGFNGKVLTDMDQGGMAEGANAAMRAGLDGWLTRWGISVRAESDADIYYLQRSAHNTLYAMANGNLMPVNIANWQAYSVALGVELVLLMVLCVAALVLRNRKPKAVAKEVPAAK